MTKLNIIVVCMVCTALQGVNTVSEDEYQVMRGGIKIPSIGLGTFAVTDEAELSQAVDKALEIGYRHIDTASLYRNEHIIGKVLHRWLSEGKLKREDIFITTKLNLFKMTPQEVEQNLKESLKLLQLDYVDLYLIHQPIGLTFLENGTWSDILTDHLGLWKKMEEQVDAGRAKTIGISNFNITQIQRILDHSRIKPANLQIEIHPYNQMKKTREFCKKNDIVVVAYSPLGAPAANSYLRSNGFGPIPLPDILHNEDILKIASKHKKSAAQITLRFLHQSGIVVIPKSTHANRLKENFEIFDFNLDPEEMKIMEKLDKGIKAKIFDMKFATLHYADNPEYPWTALKD